MMMQIAPSRWNAKRQQPKGNCFDQTSKVMGVPRKLRLSIFPLLANIRKSRVRSAANSESAQSVNWPC